MNLNRLDPNDALAFLIDPAYTNSPIDLDVIVNQFLPFVGGKRHLRKLLKHEEFDILCPSFFRSYCAINSGRTSTNDRHTPPEIISIGPCK